MGRALGITVAFASLLIGCVSVGGPSTTPSSGPTFGITTPVAATARPPETSVPTPTQAPTATPTAPTTEPPTAEPTETSGAENGDLVLFDDMSDPASGWAVGSFGSSSSAYADGVLRLVVADPGQAIWSGRTLGTEYGVVLAAAAFVPSAGSSVGVLCSTAEGEMYGAALTSTGSVIFFSIIAGVTAALETRDDLGLELPVGEVAGFGIECAGTSTGALRLAAVLQGQGALATYQNSEGPASFNGVVVYGEAFQQAITLDVDQVAAYGIPGSATGMSPEAVELLTHVPSDWGQTCIDTPSTNEATAVVSCFLQTEGVGAELAIFQQFSSNEDMDANYQENVDEFGVESQGTCETGPNETTWSINQEVRGRVQCAPQSVGIRFDWTDDQLQILSALFDFDGDYENTYNLWLEAGPI